eukprot:TRINITY_DN186_c0_g1_i1.p1 TRINITY_DN186_c0_g1~~TRINITY_DN186_c0_g1_i1.p1  ORF type:complete len:652 (-),score=166.58 TRINITY_DN186_c0_g1_i1:402-2357(-)
MSTTSPNRLMYSREFILGYSHIKKEDVVLSEKIAIMLSPVHSKPKKPLNGQRTPFTKKSLTTTWDPSMDPRMAYSEKKNRTNNTLSNCATRFSTFTPFTPEEYLYRSASSFQNTPYSPTKDISTPTHLRSKSFTPATLTTDSQKENVPNLNSTPLKTPQQLQKRLPKTPITNSSHFGTQTPVRKSTVGNPVTPHVGVSMNHSTDSNSNITVIVSEAPHIDNVSSTNAVSPIIKTPRARHVYHPKSTSPNESTESIDSNTSLNHSRATDATQGTVYVPRATSEASGASSDTQSLSTPPSSPPRNLVSPTIEPRSPAPAGYQGPGTPYKSPKPSKTTPLVMSTPAKGSEELTVAVVGVGVVSAPTLSSATAETAVCSSNPSLPSLPTPVSNAAVATPLKTIASVSATPAKMNASIVAFTPAKSGNGLGYVSLSSTSGTPLKSPKSPRPISPLDEQRLLQRQKQIDYGYRTVGYLRYRLLVTKEQRKPDHPRTPKKTQACSKRSWDGQLKKWRRDLHLWDPDNMDAFRALLNSDLVVGIIATNPELSEIVHIVREKMDNPNATVNEEEDFLSPSKSPAEITNNHLSPRYSSSMSLSTSTSTTASTTSSTSSLPKVSLTTKSPTEIEGSMEKKVSSPSRIPPDGSLQKVARTLVF